MAKKNKKNSQQRSKRSNILVLSGAISLLVFGAVAFFLFQNVGASNQEAGEFLHTHEPGSEKHAHIELIEKRPVKSPAAFRNPKVGEVYRIAAKIPEVLDQIYCYCHCSTNPRFRHKTLLTCFTDNHGAGCGICLKEVLMSYAGVQEGLGIEAIQAKIDRKYKR